MSDRIALTDVQRLKYKMEREKPKSGMTMSSRLESQQLNRFNHIESVLDRNPDCEIISVNDSTEGLTIELAIADRGAGVSICFDSFRGYRSFDEGDLYSYFQTLNIDIRSGIFVGANTEFLNWAKKRPLIPRAIRVYVTISSLRPIGLLKCSRVRMTSGYPNKLANIL